MHRVGRTGRAGESGTAISLLAPSDAELADELSAMLAASSSGGGIGGDAQQPAAAAAAAAAESDTDDDEAAAARAAGTSTRGGPAGGLQPHQRLTKAAVEGLRYRAEDVARSITRNVIKEARAKELKNELLNSQRLAAFFEEHPSGECICRELSWVGVGGGVGGGGLVGGGQSCLGIGAGSTELPGQQQAPPRQVGVLPPTWSFLHPPPSPPLPPIASPLQT